MRIAHGYEKVAPPLESSVLTIGTYDGVHQGHRTIIGGVVRRARALGVPAVVYSFYPPPWRVLGGAKVPYLITNARDKARLIAELGVDLLVTEAFTPAIRNMSHQAFAEEVFRARFAASEIHVGYDFAFGRNRLGSAAWLREAYPDLNVLEHRAVQEQGRVIGCTLIRQLVVDGEVEEAARLLGRHHFVSGVVVRGRGRGRKIGYPTANVQPRTELLPPAGVYAVRLEVGGTSIRGVANLGFRPTFAERDLSLEVHLFDVAPDLYGERVRVSFVSRLREERRFESAEELVAQIHRDAARAREVLSVGD